MAVGDITGQRILVVEDDFLLATDTADTLTSAGADVVGPCRTEKAALEKIIEGTLTGAVVDINLGSGPSFKLAETLQQAGIPFLIMTGYDDRVIPSTFAKAPRLQKPVVLEQMVKALARLCQTPIGNPLGVEVEAGQRSVL